MIELICISDRALRLKKRSEVLKKYQNTPISLDDSLSSFAGLESFVYPSLFSLSTPVVHALFLISSFPSELDKNLIKQMIASPTVFILEEISLSATVLKDFEKNGAIVHALKENKTPIKTNTIFNITNIFSLENKKDKWLILQSSLEEHAPEALIGILYWKLRTLIEANNPKKAYLKEFYFRLMSYHKEAWQKGVPLSLVLEKTILES